MKKLLSSLVVVLFLTACGSSPEEPTVLDLPQTEEDPGESEDLEGNENPEEQQMSSTENFLLFTYNAQEFIYQEESVETLNRILDLHEEYEIPLDVYLTESILKVYEELDSQLVKRLRDTSFVAISYHYRPPYPYHSSAYDFLGLKEMSTQELTETLTRYEEYELDLVTGETTEEPGGYQYVKDTVGYAPIMVGMAVDTRIMGDALGLVYKEKGASFVVVHEDVDLGSERFNLYVRPEHIEVKLFEEKDQEIAAWLAQLWEEDTHDAPRFMNIKVHDNDFIATQSAWASIYLHRKPPYRLEQGTSERELLSEVESGKLWTAYEAALQFASENREEFTPINAFDLLEMVKAE